MNKQDIIRIFEDTPEGSYVDLALYYDDRRGKITIWSGSDNISFDAQFSYGKHNWSNLAKHQVYCHVVINGKWFYGRAVSGGMLCGNYIRMKRIKPKRRLSYYD